MMNKKALFDSEIESKEINISPLIDVVFILLIFFIVTAVFVKDKGVDVTRPQAASAELLDKTSVFISISRDGEVSYRGRVIGAQGVTAVVQNQTDKVVVIQADENVSTKLLVEVLDNAKLAGAASISLATRD